MAASAKMQAGVAIGLAALLAAAWAWAGPSVQIRWIVARGAPPATDAAAAQAEKDLRAIGIAARDPLVGLFKSVDSRAKKSWIASVLLRAPFFATAEIEKGLASPDASTARAAAFALMEGEEDRPHDDSGMTVLQDPRNPAPPVDPMDKWNPAPAIPVLVDWVADRKDLVASHAARLLGEIPPGDPRPVEALLRVVDEIPEILGANATPEMRLRKPVVLAALRALQPRAKSDPSIVQRVAKPVAWIAENHLGDLAFDIQSEALRLAEQSKGRGVPAGLFASLAEDPSAPVRQRLAGTLEEVPGAEATALLERLAGAREPTVRRSAVLALVKRRDPVLFRLAPRLVEDSYVYIASDCLRGIGEMWSTEPAGARAIVPLLVSRLEDPWPGDLPGSPLSGFIQDGKVAVIEAAILSLHKITRLSPGFDERKGDLLDWKRREEMCRVLAGDAERRKDLVDEWRRTVEPPAPAKRIPVLVGMLEAKDEDNVLRALRELARLTGDSGTFPAAALTATADDSAPRNAIREWRGTPAFAKALETWKERAK